jgi:hypothetical protein
METCLNETPKGQPACRVGFAPGGTELPDCNRVVQRARLSFLDGEPIQGNCSGQSKVGAIFDQILEQFPHFGCMLLIASPLIDPGRAPREHK